MAINKTHCLLIINCVGSFKNKLFQVSKQFLPIKYHIYQIVKVPEIKNTAVDKYCLIISTLYRNI